MRKAAKKLLTTVALTMTISSVSVISAMSAEWKLENGQYWIYVDEKGDRLTGWQKNQNIWYYMDQNGIMQTGWVQTDGKWYYLNESGAMLANTTTPDGYQVGADGARIETAGPSVGAAAKQSTAVQATNNDAAQPAAITGTYNVNNVDAEYAIEADVTVTGSGGSVAKVVIVGQSSAIAFDIVTDGTTTYFYRESIRHNNQGGQDYSTLGQFMTAEYGKTYHLMVAFNKSTGLGTYYINGEMVDQFYNSDLTRSPAFIPAVECSAMIDGSTVQASFANINIKKDGIVSISAWHMQNMDNNPGLHSDTSQFTSQGIITMGGTLQLKAGENWDTAYDGSSAIIQFQ